MMPKLAPHVRLRFDATRNQSVLLGPESVAVLNKTSADILEFGISICPLGNQRSVLLDGRPRGWDPGAGLRVCPPILWEHLLQARALPSGG
jgi:hypothetical protein